MKKLISLYICLFLICFPCISFSQEEKKPATKNITVELLDEEANLVKWKNVKYVLVDEELGNILFERYEKYPELELKIEKLAELSTLYSHQLTLSTSINENLKEQNGLVIKENVGLKKIIAAGDPWWKSSWFLISLGFLAGSGLTVGIMYLVK